MKKRKPYSPGYSPPNATAWCAYHGRGMNDAYIRKKRCLMKRRGHVCKNFQWLPCQGEKP